jgi:kynurenine formamidase
MSGWRLVDLSHEVREGEPTYPGFPTPVITSHLTREQSRTSYAEGTEFTLDLITMIGNTGTYLDSPFHRYADGTDLAGLSLETLVDRPTVVIGHPWGSGRAIEAAEFDGLDVRGCAVLFHTGWDEFYATDRYGVGAPFLSVAAVHALVDGGAALVGIDSVNVDDPVAQGPRPAHSLLLAAGIHVVEHLTCLDAVPDSGALFTAVPPKVRGFGTFPVRAFAKVPA